MSEVEKQESQKTVVAFITGLLIGGLLVWIFSSSPDEKVQPEEKKAETEQVEKKDAQTSSNSTNENSADGEEVKTEVSKMEIGDGNIAVAEQEAGAVVALGTLTFPTKSGWIVVRDDVNGTPGNVLGAARFNADEGLSPTEIDLIRNIESGKSYQVMFYTQEGTTNFTLGEDKPIDGTTATFKTK